MSIEFEDCTKSDKEILRLALDMVRFHVTGDSEGVKQSADALNDTEYQQGLLMSLELLTAMVYDLTLSRKLINAVVERGILSAKEVKH